MWNQVKDHCHALAPFNEKKWRAYEVWSDDFGLMMGVDYDTGIFNIKGQVVHPANEQGESLSFLTGKQEFLCDEARKILNGTNYFPIYGRKIFKGDWGESLVIFCGWKRKFGDHTVEKMIFLYPNGQIAMN